MTKRSLDQFRDVVLKLVQSQENNDSADARRYRFLRARNLGGIVAGEVFALMAPQKVGLSGPEVDAVIDLHMANSEEKHEPGCECSACWQQMESGGPKG